MTLAVTNHYCRDNVCIYVFASKIKAADFMFLCDMQKLEDVKHLLIYTCVYIHAYSYIPTCDTVVKLVVCFLCLSHTVVSNLINLM